MHRGREVREESTHALERLFFGCHLVVDGAVPRVDLRSAERLAVDVFTEARDHRWSGDEQLRRLLHHHAVVRRDDACGAEPGDGSQAARHDRDRREVGDDVFPAWIERHERPPLGFQ